MRQRKDYRKIALCVADPECGLKKIHALGMCAKHYKQQRNENPHPRRVTIRHHGTVNRTSTPTYSGWRAMRLHHKDAGIVDRWLGMYGFVNFREDLGERPPNSKLHRFDKTKPFGPDNCAWLTRIELLRYDRVTASNKSGLAGVAQAPNSTDRWVAYFHYNMKKYTVGTFDTIEEAVEARRVAIEKFIDEVQAKIKR